MIPFSEKTDLDLIYVTRAGNLRAFRFIVERNQDKIFRSAMAYLKDPSLAEDIAQETILKA